MNGYLVTPIIQVILCLVLALLVLATRRHYNALQLLFVQILAALGLWGVLIYGMRSSPDIEHALIWERILVPIIFLYQYLFIILQ